MKTIELSTFNSKEVLSNSEYVCTFPPVQIDNGSEIAITQAFIDSQINGSYQNISINDDTTISFTFGIFYSNMFDNNKQPNIANDPFHLYVMRNANTHELYVDTLQFLLPKGNYTPMELANIITKSASLVPPQQNILDIALVPGSLLKESNVLYSFPCNPNVRASSEKEIDTPITQLNASQIPVNPLIFPHFPAGAAIKITWKLHGYGTQSVNTTIVSFDQATGNIEIVPRPDPDSGFLYPNYTAGDYFDSIQISLTTPMTATFYNQNNINDSFEFANPVYIGTSQFALEFDQNSGKFQFTQIHMPMYETNGGSSEAGVAVLETGASTNVFGPVDVRSGIFFHDIQPASFWSSLGFDLQTLLVVDNPTTHTLVNGLVRGINITSHFFGYDGFISASYADPKPTAAPFFYITDTVISIEASNQLPNGDSAYYLIELVGCSTDYLTDDGALLSSVMNIASKNYNQSGFITAYNDGSIAYINNGAPFVLSSLKVRILDPITKQLVNTLGPKNSIFIQIS